MQERDQDGVPPSGQAVYSISVAAELSGIGIQTPRLYEQHGLITPPTVRPRCRSFRSAPPAPEDTPKRAQAIPSRSTPPRHSPAPAHEFGEPR